MPQAARSPDSVRAAASCQVSCSAILASLVSTDYGLPVLDVHHSMSSCKGGGLAAEGSVAGCLKAGQSDWQRRQAVQRREAERRAREQAKLDKEQYLASQQQTAEDRTANLDRQVRVLDGPLTDSLSGPRLTFQELKVSPRISRFDPGP